MLDIKIRPPDWLLQMTPILEALNEGVVIVDDQLRIVFANEALVRLGGYDLSDVYGRTPDSIFPQQDLPYVIVGRG
jgi:PAS domain S-box-containing protein